MALVHAALITGADELELRPFEDAAPTQGMLTVDISLCGVCGTDISSFRSGHLHSPAVCGHEWVGVVSAVGPGVDTVSEGDRVVVGVRPPCGGCPECRAGLGEHCRVALAMARGRDALAPQHGGFARSITVEATRVLLAHPKLSDEEAALVEPTAVAFRGIRRSHIDPGDTVVVQGGGPVGLLAMQLARQAGAGHVILIEPTALRRQLALDLGADAVFAPGEEARDHLLERTRSLGADLVLECAGVPALVQQAVDLIRPGGNVMILSYIATPTMVEPRSWLSKAVTVRASVAYTHDDFRRTMDLIADGRIRVTPLHTRTVGLGQLEDTLRDLAGSRTDDIKVLVDPRGDVA